MEGAKHRTVIGLRRNTSGRNLDRRPLGNDHIRRSPGISRRAGRNDIRRARGEERREQAVDGCRRQDRRTWGNGLRFNFGLLLSLDFVAHTLKLMVDGATGRALNVRSTTHWALGSGMPLCCQLTCHRSAYIRMNRGGLLESISSSLKLSEAESRSLIELSQVNSCGGGSGSGILRHSDAQS